MVRAPDPPGVLPPPLDLPLHVIHSRDLVVWPLPYLGRGQTHEGHSSLISLWLQNAIDQSASEPAALTEHSIYVPGASLAFLLHRVGFSLLYGHGRLREAMWLAQGHTAWKWQIGPEVQGTQIPTLTPQ